MKHFMLLALRLCAGSLVEYQRSRGRSHHRQLVINTFANYTKYDISTGAATGGWANRGRGEFTGLDQVNPQGGRPGAEYRCSRNSSSVGGPAAAVKMSFAGGVGLNGAPNDFGLGSDPGDISFKQGRGRVVHDEALRPRRDADLYTRSDNGSATLAANVGSAAYSLPEQRSGRTHRATAGSS